MKRARHFVVVRGATAGMESDPARLRGLLSDPAGRTSSGIGYPATWREETQMEFEF
jgi:hypothetical protein